MSETAKLRFPLEVGILLRSSVRRALNKLKRDVEWEEPQAVFKIEEEKGLLSSIFYVEITNISAQLALSVKSGVEKFVEELSS